MKNKTPQSTKVDSSPHLRGASRHLNSQKEQNILEHLSDFKRVILLPLCAFLIFFSICYFFSPQIFAFCSKKYINHLAFLSIEDSFLLKIQIGTSCGFLCSIPFLYFGIYKFCNQAFEKITQTLFTSFVLFLCGVFLGYFFCLPLACDFFFDVAKDFTGIKSVIDVRKFFSLIVFISFSFGICMQLPILLVMFINFGIINKKTLKKYRRIVFILCFILGGILTPPDVFSQVILSLTIYFLFEASIFVSKSKIQT